MRITLTEEETQLALEWHRLLYLDNQTEEDRQKRKEIQFDLASAVSYLVRKNKGTL